MKKKTEKKLYHTYQTPNINLFYIKYKTYKNT